MIQVLSDKRLLENLSSVQNPNFEEYYAFYSSWFGGITTNPRLMLVPVDDHMVHRGDGVFEAMKAVKGKFYLMNEHLTRLAISADKIFLKLPFDMDHVKDVILATVKAADHEDVSIRVYLARGPGNFTVSPYDSIQTQLYVAVSKLNPPGPEKYSKGVILGKSCIPAKPKWMAQVKSCNYLPNVLMKKEAVDRKLDFVIGIDADGFISESATENIMMVDQQGMLIHPPLDGILKGTTMVRTFELARENGMSTAVKPISLKDLLAASEVMITGTTLNVLPAVKFEDTTIGNGRPGPIAKKLNELILADIGSG